MKAVELAEAFSIVQAHLARSTVDLFAAYGFDLEPAAAARSAPPSDGETLVATIGYAGDAMRGALILSAPVRAVRAWMIASGSPVEATYDGAEADAIGEFANMLLGRLKLRLLGDGLTILLSTPTTSKGGSLGLPPPTAASGWFAFRGPGWHVAVRVDTSFEQGMRMRRPLLVEPSAQAGDALFF